MLYRQFSLVKTPTYKILLTVLKFSTFFAWFLLGDDARVCFISMLLALKIISVNRILLAYIEVDLVFRIKRLC